MAVVGNKVVFEKQKRKELESHRSRIKNMKSSIDTTAPESMTLKHLKCNYRKEFMKEEREERERVSLGAGHTR